MLGGLRACFTWTQIDVQNDQDIQGQINAPVPDMAVGNYCAKLADDKKEQKKIFEPFYSSKNSNTSWGMGLYHVRTIVRAHVGSLRVESKPGRGTSFFVLLPKYVQDR